MENIEKITKETLAYFEKTSKHLFITEGKSLYKILPFQVDGKNYIVIITINKNGVTARVQTLNFEYFGPSTLHNMKAYLFPVYDKRMSIPNFKKMRELTALIEKELTTADQKVLEPKIKEILQGLEFVDNKVA